MGLAWLIPLLIAAVYVVVFVLQIPQNVRAIGWISDYSSGFTMVETLAKTGTGGNTVIASSGQYVSLWFGLLTAGLPLHRELWQITPTLLFLASALLIGWSVTQVGVRFSGALATLLIVIASPRAAAFFMAAVAHNLVYPATALMGAYLIWLTRAAGRSRILAFGLPAAAGVVLGACLGSDLLIGATTVIPLGATAVLAGLRRNRPSHRVALSTLTTVLIAVAVAQLMPSIMNSQGYFTIPAPTMLAHGEALTIHARLLFEGLKTLFNGYLDQGAPGTLHPELGVACEVIMCATFLVLLVLCVRTTINLMLSGWRHGNQETPTELARSLHIIYWIGSAITVCVAFLLTAETGTSVAHESYYLSVILSVGAVIPLFLDRGTVVRWLILAGTAIFFTGSLAGLTSNYIRKAVSSNVPQYGPAVLRLAGANHVSVGYAGYWEASSFTWSTDNKLRIRPVMECNTQEGTALCPMYLMRVPSWYVPKPRHSFLLVDAAEAFVRTIPTGLGRPLAAYNLGSVEMLVYPYDLASRLGPFLN